MCPKKKTFLNLFASILILFVFASQNLTAARAQGLPATKIALIVVNEEYDQRTGFDVLETGNNDALLIENTFRQLGVEVFEGHALKNQTTSQIKEALVKFKNQAEDYDHAFVYFSGHGITIRHNGKSFQYFVPIGSIITHWNEDFIPLSDILNASNARQSNMVMLNACRTETDSLNAQESALNIELSALNWNFDVYDGDRVNSILLFAAENGEPAYPTALPFETEGGPDSTFSPFAWAISQYALIENSTALNVVSGTLDKVPVWTKHKRPAQRPQQMSWSSGSFPMASGPETPSWRNVVKETVEALSKDTSSSPGSQAYEGLSKLYDTPAQYFDDNGIDPLIKSGEELVYSVIPYLSLRQLDALVQSSPPDPLAAYLVANAYLSGITVEPNRRRSRKYAQIAADQGYGLGLHLSAYLDYMSPPKTVAEQSEYAERIEKSLEAAAAEGVVKSHVFLGNNLVSGEKLNGIFDPDYKDAEKGLTHLKVAAEAGSDDALLRLGMGYYCGKDDGNMPAICPREADIGLPRNSSLGRSYLDRAASAASYRQICLINLSERSGLAYEHCDKAANLGDPDAQERLAWSIMFPQTNGALKIPESKLTLDNAYSLLLKATRQGSLCESNLKECNFSPSPSALNLLGDLFQGTLDNREISVPANIKTACGFWQRAFELSKTSSEYQQSIQQKISSRCS